MNLINQLLLKSALSVLIFLPSLVLGQKAVVSTPKTNILYYGIDNPVRIAVDRIPFEYILLKCLTPEVAIMKKNNEFNVKPLQLGDIKFLIVNKLDSSFIDSFDLRIARVPEPTFNFHKGGLEGGDVFLDYLVVSNEILDKYDIKYSIVRFDVFAKRDTELLFDLTNDGASFSSSVKKAFGNLHVGDILGISRIWFESEGVIRDYNVHLFTKIL